MKVYVSSTFVDLKRYRDAAIRILRQLGHEVVAMEDYTSDSAIPLKKVLKDIKACDAYVGIIAWRYGYIPGDKAQASKKKRAIPKGLVLPDSKAGKYGETSITEWEYLQAAENKIPTLAFLLDDESPWPPHLVDGFEEGGSKVKVQSFREILQRDRTVAYFKSPEDLAAKVSAATTRVNMSQLVSVNLLDPDKYTESNLDLVTSDEIVAGGRKEKLVSAVIGAETKAIIRIDIKAAKWWSTRLFLLACLMDKLTDTQQILVVQEEKFVGLLPVPAIIRQFSSSDAELSKFERKVAGSSANRGAIKNGAEKLIDDWNSILPKRVER
ncbi:MAG: DUF4062 domain-containing protein, partial [Rhodospirillaceae bacterium]|nr:DUF4062 domain-containing protein [Rhodospirillaceae bacterium]